MPKSNPEKIIDQPFDPSSRRAGGGGTSVAPADHLHDLRYFTEAEITGATDLSVPADTDELVAIRGGGLGTLLWSALKTALTTLYVGLTGNQTVAGNKTFTGDTHIGDGAGTPNLRIDGAAGTSRSLAFRTGGVNRFLYQVTATAEGGANAGSNWTLLARADDGSSLSVPIFVDRASGRLVLGGAVAAPTPRAKVDIVQPSTTAAIPVLLLEQTDVSDPMIRFVTTVGTGNTIQAVAALAFTPTHYLKVSMPDGSIRYIELGTVA